MPEQVWTWMHLVGRILFASFAIFFGLRHLIGMRVTARFLESREVPGPKPVAFVTGIMLLVGGTFVLLGWHRFIGAGLLFLVLFPGGWALHAFWTESDPADRMDQMGHFMKTVALAGAALIFAYYAAGPWPLSLGN